MVTYPSTHGVFEAASRDLRDRAPHGGQVYVDGANMNAHGGLCAPGEFGGDVSHLNLHKTFCIPHGGGGPAWARRGARAPAPFLPGHPLPGRAAAGDRRGLGRALRQRLDPADLVDVHRDDGPEGLTARDRGRDPQRQLRRAPARAALPGALLGPGGLVAHECILDLRPLKETSGITVEDVAKRLIDYGFHAPTMSFPVPARSWWSPPRASRRRARPLLRRDDRDPRRDPRGGGGRMDREDNPLSTRRTPPRS
jgi:glycine dehydrogenase